MWLHEHRHSLRGGHLDKSELTQYAYEEGQVVSWDDLGFWKLKITAGMEIQGIGPYGILSQSKQLHQFGHLSHLDPTFIINKITDSWRSV
jgi:hypothetical protein